MICSLFSAGTPTREGYTEPRMVTGDRRPETGDRMRSSAKCGALVTTALFLCATHHSTQHLDHQPVRWVSCHRRQEPTANPFLMRTARNSRSRCWGAATTTEKMWVAVPCCPRVPVPRRWRNISLQGRKTARALCTGCCAGCTGTCPRKTCPE